MPGWSVGWQQAKSLVAAFLMKRRPKIGDRLCPEVERLPYTVSTLTLRVLIRNADQLSQIFRFR